MNGKNTNPQRRQALKKILAGSSIVGASAVVPDKWVKPVVDVVVLPAHAQPSPAFMLPLNATWAGGGGGNGFGSLEPKSGEGLAMRVLDQIVPAARAQDNMSIADCHSSVTVCLDTMKVGENQVNVRLAVIPGPQGSATADVVNGVIQQPFMIEGYTVTGTLSDNAQTWTGTVEGTCPGKNIIRVESDGVFTGERIDVAALPPPVVPYIGFENLNVGYEAQLNAKCRIIMNGM